MEQLQDNVVQIRREGDANSTLRIRSTGASVTRDIAGIQERFDVFQMREFVDVVHQSFSIEIRGNVRTGGFLRYMLDHVSTFGGVENELDVLLFPASGFGSVNLFTLQVSDGSHARTFYHCALQRLAFELKAKRKQAYSATFLSLRSDSVELPWNVASEEDGEILTFSDGFVALGTTFAGGSDLYETTTFEASLELGFPELEVTQFDASGIPRSFSRSATWDVTGRLLLPESGNVTSDALASTWGGFLALRTSNGSERFEIEAPITAQIDRFTALAWDWRQYQVEFVGRRDGSNIARVLTNHTALY